MDKLTAIETDLSKAREALTALQDELPQFRALLSENEQDAQRFKTERASLNEQAQARSRVQIAKEMLEQHQSDIATARAEVVRLEALERRVLILQQIATHAQRTTKHRKKLEKTVHETRDERGTRAGPRADGAGVLRHPTGARPRTRVLRPRTLRQRHSRTRKLYAKPF